MTNLRKIKRIKNPSFLLTGWKYLSIPGYTGFGDSRTGYTTPNLTPSGSRTDDPQSVLTMRIEKRISEIR